MKFDPNVWGPHYWFVLLTIAMTYPIEPNDVIKKSNILTRKQRQEFEYHKKEEVIVASNPTYTHTKNNKKKK